MRRSKSIERLLPILYLKGISTGDFSEALAALLGKDAAGLSASAIGRLKDGWFDEHTAWQPFWERRRTSSSATTSKPPSPIRTATIPASTDLCRDGQPLQHSHSRSPASRSTCSRRLRRVTPSRRIGRSSLSRVSSSPIAALTSARDGRHPPAARARPRRSAHPRFMWSTQ